MAYSDFDQLDRAGSRTQTIGTMAPMTSTALYNASELTSETYPSGRVITYDVDDIGRVSGVKSGTTHYLGSATYAAHGGMASALFGDGMTETHTWDYRLQPLSIARGAVLSLAYSYCPGATPGTNTPCTAHNGNPFSQLIGPLNVTQSYTYDSLGRLAIAEEGSAWSRSHSYDPYGNQWVSAWTGISPSSFTPQSNAFNSRNQLTLQGAGYDRAGNQNTIGAGSYVMAFDAENHMVSSTLSGGTTTYAYDGEGHRVQKINNGVTTTYAYDVRGQLVAEYSSGSPSNNLTCTTCYLIADHLGSTRLITAGGTGQVAKRIDYLPFGEIIPAGAPASDGRTTTLGYEAVEDPTAPSPRFTGQYRDTETKSSAMPSGLDFFGARYFSGAQGRFTTPDWSERPEPVPYADLSDPQTLNLYGYVRNNPLSRTDPDGTLLLGLHCRLCQRDS